MNQVIINGIEYVPKEEKKVTDAGCGWEIVAFKNIKPERGANIWYKESDGMFRQRNDFYKHGWAEQDFLNTPDCEQIHSVKRLSDGVVFSVGDEVDFDGGRKKKAKITGFYISEWLNKDMMAMFNGESGGHNILYCKKLSPQPITEKEETNYKHPVIFDQSNDFNRETPNIKSGEDNLQYMEAQSANPKSCHICGGETVLIRGKYPGCDPRNVCPTCTTERLEQISEISSPDYGKTCKA